MKCWKPLLTPACFAAMVAALCCLSAPAQTPGTEPVPEEMREPEPLQPGEAQPQAVPGPAVDATEDTGVLPEKRNPFWTVGWYPGKPTNGTPVVARPTAGTEPRVPSGVVDWVETEKYVKERAKVQIFNQGKPTEKILVVFEGRIYEIGQSLSVTLDGNVYTFKLKDGATLERQGVRPAGN